MGVPQGNLHISLRVLNNKTELFSILRHMFFGFSILMHIMFGFVWRVRRETETWDYIWNDDHFKIVILLGLSTPYPKNICFIIQKIGWNIFATWPSEKNPADPHAIPASPSRPSNVWCDSLVQFTLEVEHSGTMWNPLSISFPIMSNDFFRRTWVFSPFQETSMANIT